jgi:N,N'-diacetyllegionaminate synthase
MTKRNIELPLGNSIKRPGNGINPMRWDEIVGSVASKSYDEDELI